METPKEIKFVFWGTDEFSTTVLNQLKKFGFKPSLIITAPDRKSGRGQKLQSPPVKIWAEENKIEILQPEKFDDNFIKILKENDWDVFALASYGKIVPSEILALPKKGTLNVHPSLLPLYRGASPIESAILDDNKNTGVTIMLMDAQMDHGPIINQEFVSFTEWPTKPEIENKLAEIGGQLLAESMLPWINDEIEAQEQAHDMATFTSKIKKEDGLIDLGEDPRKNFLKIQAYQPWPGAYFFTEKGDKKIRVKITKASFANNNLKIERVIPEGKSEMDYQSFLLSAKS